MFCVGQSQTNFPGLSSLVERVVRRLGSWRWSSEVPPFIVIIPSYPALQLLREPKKHDHECYSEPYRSSYSSAQTYSQNNAEMSSPILTLSPRNGSSSSTWIPVSFLRPSKYRINHVWSQTRGFKTRSGGSGIYPKPRQPGVVSVGSGEAAKSQDGGTRVLTHEEKLAAAAAIHGYMEGKKTPDVEGSALQNTKMIIVKYFIYIVVGMCITVYACFRLLLHEKSTHVVRQIEATEVNTTFEDVKGCDESKNELYELVDFLKNPDKYNALGGKIPKGFLLVGPPGTGKTLLARAVAGQAGVPFYQVSGSEFDEIFVGMGAARVRNMFRVARQNAPCVVFIDEIDSVGSKRTTNSLHPYANHTINQLLAEMDGFTPNEGVVVIGATNNKQVLDKALLRPGRFDMTIEVPLPDVKGRRETLELYLAKVKHQNIDVDSIARKTVGFSGADLENLVNAAALRAAADGKLCVSMLELDYAFDKVTLGLDMKSRVRSEEELRTTAFHEAGHTLVCHFTPNTSPLHKVTIVAKGQTGGHTASLPSSDSPQLQTKAQLLAQLDVLMGGRAAEELIFSTDKVSIGAQSDLSSATQLAESMVMDLGMSEKVGLRVYPSSNRQNISPENSALIDSEIHRLLDESYKRAMAVLKSHRKELDLLVEALLKYETLHADDIKCILAGEKMPARVKPHYSSVSSKILRSSSAASSATLNGDQPASLVSF